jgi:hypothetical protein
MLEPEYYWVRYKGNAISGMYVHGMYRGWQPAIYDAAERILGLFGYDEAIPADLFEIGPVFAAPSSLTGNTELCDMKSMNYSAIRRSLRAPIKGLNRAVIQQGNWLLWLCKLIGHSWRNIYWDDSATVWRVRCALCKKAEERSWK